MSVYRIMYVAACEHQYMYCQQCPLIKFYSPVVPHYVCTFTSGYQSNSPIEYAYSLCTHYFMGDLIIIIPRAIMIVVVSVLFLVSVIHVITVLSNV